ncbi:MAG TPA: ABC transporter permease [Candidatus Limnocylindria bacterium]|nr:ABC transporter permease [Candidatus Limnocylindria bacterium]
MATTTADIAAVSPVAVPARRASAGLWSDAWYRLRRDKLTMASIVVLVILIVLSAAAPLFEEHVFKFKFAQQDLLGAYAKPQLEKPQYLLGSDELGRSQVVRLLYGGQVSLFVGFFAAAIQLTIGVSLGLIAGYKRGFIDDAITFFITVLNSIPTLFLLLIITALFSPSALTLIVILGLLGWAGITLFVRGQTFSLREREFVTAARTVGASGFRIMTKHILPNVLPFIFILAAIDIGTIILIESALSYLGLGILPPTPSWGNMLSNAASYFNLAWWLVVSPGVMIFLTVLCLYLIGDGLRDALDPRLRGAS